MEREESWLYKVVVAGSGVDHKADVSALFPKYKKEGGGLQISYIFSFLKTEGPEGVLCPQYQTDPPPSPFCSLCINQLKLRSEYLHCEYLHFPCVVSKLKFIKWRNIKMMIISALREGGWNKQSWIAAILTLFWWRIEMNPHKQCLSSHSRSGWS